MSRTPENENIIRNENQTSYGGMQADLAKFAKNEGTLQRGGEVGTDPYETPGYLANQNRLTADVTSGEKSAAKQQLEMANRRAGGQNTGATNATVANLAMGKMRLGNQLQTQQKAQDFSKNLQWQQYLAGAPLQSAGVQEGVVNSTQSSMSQYALAQQKQWYDEIGQMIQAGKAAASAGMGAATGGAGVGGFGEG